MKKVQLKLIPLIAVIFTTATAFTTVNLKGNVKRATLYNYSVYALPQNSFGPNESANAYKFYGTLIGEDFMPMNLVYDFPDDYCWSDPNYICMAQIENYTNSVFEVRYGDYEHIEW
jgi:hypothetical protein